MEISKRSRVWIYQSNRPFSSQEEQHINEKLGAFLSQWEAHGNKLTAKATIYYNRFIVLMVDEELAGATGCSIDKSVNLMKQLEQELNISLFDRFNIAYRDASGVASCDRGEFEKLITEGKVTKGTIVFNNLVQTVDEFEQHWEVPFKLSWHEKLFGSLIPA
ncbi:ABC transporter ATPase [Paradesertivirga mongoliensis]|uniref:ABC transporter ATPase n=1 Tax=Paradesertivirga mongoliensis TaxID=2100740 RepID=A0ABW4ZH01_9SPHI|nr:ABC transporter ATPase [Pedobacter mongoliensis]